MREFDVLYEPSWPMAIPRVRWLHDRNLIWPIGLFAAVMTLLILAPLLLFL